MFKIVFRLNPSPMYILAMPTLLPLRGRMLLYVAQTTVVGLKWASFTRFLILFMMFPFVVSPQVTLLCEPYPQATFILVQKPAMMGYGLRRNRFCGLLY